MLKGLILSLLMLGNTANVNTEMHDDWERWDRELNLIYFNTNEDRMQQDYKNWYAHYESVMSTDKNWNHIKVSEEMMENLKDKGEYDTSKDGNIEMCWIRNDLVVYCVH